MKRLLLLLTILLLAASVRAQTCVKYNSTASLGGKIVTSGTTSTTSAVRAFPLATVDVYNTGTTTHTSIYSNSVCSVVKNNPFTADASTGAYSFYLAPTTVDIRIAPAGGSPAPFTTSAVLIGVGIPTGNAGGDLTGTYPNPTIDTLKVTNAKIANATIDLTTKVTGVLPVKNGGTAFLSVSGFSATTGTGSSGDPFTGWYGSINQATANIGYYFGGGPSVTYSFASPLVFTGENVKILCDSGTILKFTGTGVAISSDGGASGGGITGFGMDGCTLVGNASATKGIYLRASHHVTLNDLRVRDVTGTALDTHWSVLGVASNFRVSAIEGAFGIIPTNGFIFDKRGAGEQTTAWTVTTPTIEHVSGDGIICAECATMVFTSGTSEGNGGRGLIFATNSWNNTVIGMDNEANVGDDYTDNGTGNTFVNVLSATVGGSGMFRATTSTNTTIIGGRFNDIRLEVGAISPIVHGARYNGDGGGTFFNAPVDSDLDNIYNVTAGTWFALPNAMTTYDENGLQRVGSHTVSNSITLSAGTKVLTFTNKAIFSSAGTYSCTATDTTALNPVKVVLNSGSQITFTGTASDVINYICAGN